MTSDKGQQLGREGEDRACQYLRQQGYEIIARNWHSRFGEIDIIARDKESLVFAEVKTRSKAGFGGPEAALGIHKRKRVIAAAKAYLSVVESDLPVRFDLVALQGEKITLYKGAFCEEEPCSHAY
ncbi:MAG: YraN family protein [Candidatus Bipolaricaulota bacterium]|nr:YraN family protein [Candidatus Bipolaricaulota bacterium]